MNYKIIDVPQDTPEWLNWRKSGITATEASIIVGANPYETEDELFLVKSGQKPAEFKDNEAIQRGKTLEPLVRDKINNHFQEKFQPQCVQNLNDPFMIASLDGLSDCGKIILEIKCPISFGSHKKNFSFFDGWNLDESEVLEMVGCPAYYYAQCQWQIATVDAEYALFVSYLEGNWKSVEILPDFTYIKYMKDACLEFWQKVEKVRNGN